MDTFDLNPRFYVYFGNPRWVKTHGTYKLEEHFGQIVYYGDRSFCGVAGMKIFCFS